MNYKSNHTKLTQLSILGTETLSVTAPEQYTYLLFAGNTKRIEVGRAVVIVLALTALKKTHNGIGCRRQQNFNAALENIIRSDNCAEQVVGQRAIERYHAEDGCIHALANERANDGAHPEVPAGGADLQARKHN